MAILNNVNGNQFAALNSFINDAFDDVDFSRPQAFLVYIYFDNNMQIKSNASGVMQVGDADALGTLARNGIQIDEDGFLYAYLTNRSEARVSFNKFTITRWKPMVRVTYDYYPLGMPWRNPPLVGDPESIHDCTFQDKEFQFNECGDGVGLALSAFHVTKLLDAAQRSLRDWNPAAQRCGARMYDPAIGRWLVPDPASQFANPYLAMGNNPVSMVDPDGCFVNQIFDAMEYYSPIVIRPISHSGSDQKGRGWEISIGVPKMYGISYRWEYGRIKYKNGFGNKSGTEVYKGGEVTYGGLVSFGGKRYQGDYGDGEFTQTTGTVTIGKPFKSVKYENDIMPWTDTKLGFIDKANLGLTPSFDRGDRYRSAGLEMNAYGLSWGFQLFTGDPGFLQEDRKDVSRGDDKNVYVPGGPGTDPDKYREGILYFGVGPIRIGRNCEAKRHKIQNHLAHDNKVIQKNPYKKVPWFQITQAPNNRYFYFGSGSVSGVY
jgi:Bacterial toxin 23